MDGRRFTINLTKIGIEAMEVCQRITGKNQTDVVDRALQMAAFMDLEREQGNEVWIKQASDGEMHRVYFVG